MKREGTDISFVATSSMVQVALGAAKMLEEVGVSAEVVDPRTMWPLDEETLINSVKKTSRCIVMDEGYGRYSVAAELAAVIQEGAFFDMDGLGAPPVRDACRFRSSPALEDVTVPTKKQAFELARQMCNG